MAGNTAELTVAVYIRTQQLTEPVGTKIETLQRLESADHIDDLAQHTWPETITLSERTPHTDAIDVFKQMKAWADEHGASIRPPFGVRTTSTLTDEARTRLRTPVMCLAVYVGGQLTNVFPHSRDGEQYSVADAIAALETNDLESYPLAPARDPVGPPPDRCPACESRLTNVQGLGVCGDCNRIELGDTPSRGRGRGFHFTQRT